MHTMTATIQLGTMTPRGDNAIAAEDGGDGDEDGDPASGMEWKGCWSMIDFVICWWIIFVTCVISNHAY